MKHLITYFSLFVFILCFIQIGCTKEETTEPIEHWVEINGTYELMTVTKGAEYIGGQAAFFKAIAEEISYPAEARENDISGTVIIQFEVTEQGKVENTTIIEDIGGGCGEEAKRTLEVITQGVSFHPAEIDGVPVRVRMDLPIKFTV